MAWWDMEILPSTPTWSTGQELKTLTIDGMSQMSYESPDTTSVHIFIGTHKNTETTTL